MKEKEFSSLKRILHSFTYLRQFSGLKKKKQPSFKKFMKSPRRQGKELKE